MVRLRLFHRLVQGRSLLANPDKRRQDDPILRPDGAHCHVQYQDPAAGVNAITALAYLVSAFVWSTLRNHLAAWVDDDRRCWSLNHDHRKTIYYIGACVGQTVENPGAVLERMPGFG